MGRIMNYLLNRAFIRDYGIISMPNNHTAMNNLKQLERIKKIHRLIELQNTGRPKELAKKLNISERQVYVILEQLKEMDAPIRFNRRTNTYYYMRQFDIKINVSIQVISEENLMNIYAGKNLVNYINSMQGLCSKQNYLSYVKTKLDVVG